MSTHEILQWVHDTWLGQVARSYAPVFTTGLVIHFIGLCLLMGSMLIVDLRLLGLARQVPIKAVLALLPVAIVGFVVNLATGIVFFCFDPFGYWVNPAFQIKMVLIAIAGLNAIVFLRLGHRLLIAAPGGYDAPPLAKASAALSLLLWFGVILAGRMIVAFT